MNLIYFATKTCAAGVKYKGVSRVRRGLMRLVPARGALYQIMHGGYGVPFIKHPML
jgi:hypothetical protein